MDNHHSNIEEADLYNGDEIILDLDYEEVCYLLKGLFISQHPEHDHKDLLVKVEMKDDKIKAFFKLCPDQPLYMVHRERGKHQLLDL